MAKYIKLLGFAAAAHGAAVGEALNALAGPRVHSIQTGDIAALAQSESARLLPRRALGATGALKDLRIVQCRLEVACQRGPFLPADPAHARCRAADLPALLAAAAPAIAAALGGPGTRHQWDVILRWSAESVVAARRAEIAASAQEGGGGRNALAEAVQAALARDRGERQAALQGALSRIGLATLPAGAGVTETGITVLLPAGAEASLEAALQSLPSSITADAEADLRGPLPPISFAAVRIDSAAPAEVAAAWKTLALPAEVDSATLSQHWRAAASRLHPDRGASADAPMAEAGAAFRLLRDLLPRAATTSLPALQREATSRLRVQLADTDIAA